MATDFNAYRNLRILWHQPAAITDLRDGLPGPGDPIVIEVFAKGTGATPQELPSLRSTTTIREGFICRWAPLPEDGDWLAAGDDWSWDETGLMPPGLQSEARGRAFLGDLLALPDLTGEQCEATILELGGSFGLGGIGAELRTALGDAIRVSLARAA